MTTSFKLTELETLWSITEMRTSQLTSLLRKHNATRKVFKGVYPCDRIPNSVPSPAALIANTDPDGQPGRHWVAYYFTPSTVYFFDSYGQPPWKMELQRPMALRKYKRYFPRRLQGLSRVCGYYCLYFILAMVKGWGFQHFGRHLNRNDMLVKRMVDRHFQTTKV